MERSRYLPEKNQAMATKRYLRESGYEQYHKIDEENITPSRKGRVTTSHAHDYGQYRDDDNRRICTPENDDYTYSKRSNSRAKNVSSGRTILKQNRDSNDGYIIYEEKFQRPYIDTSSKETAEKPKKVHFQMRESRSTPLSLRTKTNKEKYGRQNLRCHKQALYHGDQSIGRHAGHIPAFDGAISSSDEDSKDSNYSDTRSLNGYRIITGRLKKIVRSKLQQPLELSDSDVSSDSDFDLEVHNKPYSTRHSQTRKEGKYSIYTSDNVPDAQAVNYKNVPSRIPRPASSMSNPKKSALKMSSSFDIRGDNSESNASRRNKAPSKENLDKSFEQESIHPESQPVFKKTRNQVTNYKHYISFTSNAINEPRKKTYIEDFESENLDENGTDESELIELRYSPSRYRTRHPKNLEYCYSVDPSGSDSDDEFEQIEVYVPKTVFKHVPRQQYDLDHVNAIHEKPLKEDKSARKKKNNTDSLELLNRSYRKSATGKIYRTPHAVKQSESRPIDREHMHRTKKEGNQESQYAPEGYNQRQRKDVELMDDVLTQSRGHYPQSMSNKNTSAESSHSYKQKELEDTDIKLLRKAEDSHRMFMSIWLPPRTSNISMAKPKRSVLDTPEHLLMLKRIVKRI